MIYNVVFLLYSKVVQLYIYVLFHYGLSQDMESISLCYTVGSCCLSRRCFSLKRKQQDSFFQGKCSKHGDY